MDIKYFFLSFLFLSIAVSVDFSEIDSYSENQKYDMEFKAIHLLSDQSNVEFVWRMARAYFNQGEEQANEKKKHELFYKSYDYSKQALELDSMSAKANHYYAVLHGQIGLIEGTKQKIINSYGVLKHGEIAINIDPNYDNTHHLLGRLNFELANLSWFERNFASLIYETPPKGTFEKAKNYFQSAISLNSGDVRHWLWLGKTYIALNEHEKAYETLLKTSSLNPKDEKDRVSIKESKKLLSRLR